MQANGKGLRLKLKKIADFQPLPCRMTVRHSVTSSNRPFLASEKIVLESGFLHPEPAMER